MTTKTSVTATSASRKLAREQPRPAKAELELEVAAMPGFGCFLCGDPAHWQHECWTTVPPTSRDHHESRLVLYRMWATEGLPERLPRITPQQRAALIKTECALWKAMLKEKEKAK